MIRRLALFRRAVVAVTLVSTVACGGGSSPSTPVPTPGGGATPTPNPAPTPVLTSCPLGLGNGRFTCQGDQPGLLPQIDAAIDKLVADQPSLFDTTNPPSAGGYFVHDVDQFYDGLVGNLMADGLCAQRDYADKDRFLVKENNDYAEVYDILTTQQRIRRGPVTFMFTCTPANFPLTADQAVVNVSVSFYRYDPSCLNQHPPHNTLPVGCRGSITATPRDAQGNKLPPELHATDARWFIQFGEGTTVVANPSPEGVPFNLVLVGRDLGEFSVCATVGNRTGCMNGNVIP